MHYRTYRKLATVSLQTGRLLSLTRTLFVPVQGWHPVFRCEGLPGCTSNLPVLCDAGPFRAGSCPQWRTFGYRLLVLLTILALLIIRHRFRRWHWLVRSFFICKKGRVISCSIPLRYKIICSFVNQSKCIEKEVSNSSISWQSFVICTTFVEIIGIFGREWLRF